jgi:phosphoribosylformylglycinamidine synthase subunit PurQ / glutaminase
MEAVKKHAEQGKLVIGICNGFQILCEAGLLPGALLRNRSLKFICKHVGLRIEETDTPFTRKAKKGARLSIPIAHGEGNYYADEATLERFKKNRHIIVRYTENPNGSLDDIAGICNEKRNVFGLMPHPERAAEMALGSEDGLEILKSIIHE